MDAETGTALQEIVNSGLDPQTARLLGEGIGRMFGTVASDAIGVLGGDWLSHVRVRNAARLMERTNQILGDRGILGATQPVSPSVGVPVLQKAQDERSRRVRRSLIDALQSLEPVDVVVLEAVALLQEKAEDLEPATHGSLSLSFGAYLAQNGESIKITADAKATIIDDWFGGFTQITRMYPLAAIMVSMNHLDTARLIQLPGMPTMRPLGVELLAACQK